MTGASGSMRILLVALALLLSVTTPALTQNQEQNEVLRLGTEVVLVNVAVTRGGDFASGLTAAEFKVSEDGVPQEIAFFGTEETPFAAAILLDTSGSMELKLRLARVAAARFMDRTRYDDRVALYLFGSEVRMAQDFRPGGRDLTDSVWDASARGNTKMYDTIADAADALAKREEQRRAILLLSDGADVGSSRSYDSALKAALASGANIYTIDMTPIGSRPATTDVDAVRARGVLSSLANKTGGRFFRSKGGDDLNDAFTQIVKELRSQYTIGYYPKNSARDGKWRKITVTTSRPGVEIRARDGYTAPSE